MIEEDEVSEVESEEIEENETEEEKQKRIFNDLKHDFTKAKSAKTEIEKLINEWNDLYYGIKRNSDGDVIKPTTNKSSFVAKEIAKQIEWQKPNITEPFTSTRHPINLVDNRNETRARHLEKWANYEFTEEFDREEFLDQITDVTLREGTAWVHTSWEHKIEDERIIIPSISMNEILMNEQEPVEIEENEDGTYRVEYTNKVMTFNNPNSEVCRNEHVFPDPSARTEKELRFLALIDKMTISSLKEIDWLDQDAVENLESRINGEERESTPLGVQRDADALRYGRSSTYEPNDKARKHIRIVQYWGFYDLDGTGFLKPIVAYWAEKEEVLLGIMENPMPFKSIPFDRVVYSARPFSIWGNAVAFFLGDNQKAKTGIMRGIFDNMSLANNGQKFLTRGAVDYVNFKRMNNGERYIIVNKPDQIQDGKYNQIPSAVFSTLQMITKESEDLVGVSSGGPAISNENVAKDGQQAQLTMSQQRMAALVRNISNLLRKVIGKWVMMAELFLTDEQIENIFSEGEEVDMNVFSISRSAKVKVRVGTEVNRNMRLQQLNMLMQQAKVLENQMPDGEVKEIVAEMYDLFDMHEKATALRAYKPQPSEAEIAAQQLQLQDAQLEIAKKQMEIQVMQKDVEARYMNAQARMMEANANFGYKGAQTEEKLAKAQQHKVDTAMKPVQTETEVMKAQGQNKMKEVK